MVYFIVCLLCLKYLVYGNLIKDAQIEWLEQSLYSLLTVQKGFYCTLQNRDPSVPKGSKRRRKTLSLLGALRGIWNCHRSEISPPLNLESTELQPPQKENC